MTDKEIRIVQKYSDQIMELIEAVKYHNLTQDEAIGIAEAIIIKVLKEREQKLDRALSIIKEYEQEYDQEKVIYFDELIDEIKALKEE